MGVLTENNWEKYEPCATAEILWVSYELIGPLPVKDNGFIRSVNPTSGFVSMVCPDKKNGTKCDDYNGSIYDDQWNCEALQPADELKKIEIECL